jgi:hypothetical protein
MILPEVLFAPRANIISQSPLLHSFSFSTAFAVAMTP